MKLQERIDAKTNEIKSTRARIDEIQTRQDEILNLCEAEDRDWTDEERAELDDLAVELETKQNELKTQEDDLVRLQNMEGRQPQSGRPLPRRTAADSGNPLSKEAHDELDDNADAPNSPDAIKHPKDVRIEVRKPKLIHFHGARNGLSAEQRAYRFGHYVLAKVAMECPGYLPRGAAQASIDFVTNYVEPSMAVTPHDSSGYNHWIPKEFEYDLIVLREKYGVGRGLLENKNMGSDSKTYPKRKGGMTAAFVGSVGGSTNSNATTVPITLVAKKIRAQGVYSIDLEDDAVADIGDDFLKEIAYAFAELEDGCIFLGDGTSSYGGITGLVPKLTGLAGRISGSGNSWGALTYADHTKLLARIPQYAADGGNLKWVCNRTYYYEVMDPLAVAQGGATRADIENGAGGIFAGIPVVFAQKMPNTSASGHVPVLLGDFMKAGMFGDRRQMQVNFTTDATLDGVNTFEEDYIGIKGTERFDVNIHDAGDASTRGAYVGLATT